MYCSFRDIFKTLIKDDPNNEPIPCQEKKVFQKNKHALGGFFMKVRHTNYIINLKKFL